MIDTYARPFWKSLLYFILITLGVCVVQTIMIYFVSFMVEGGPWAIQEGTKFSDIPYWFLMSIVFWIFSPLFGFLAYIALIYRKYDYEWRKLKLIPVFPEDEIDVMFYPHKTKEGEDPKWVKPFRFSSTLSIVGSNSYPLGSSSKTYQIFKSDKGYMFQMSQKEFNRLAPEMKDGKISGEFEWDITWHWPSIVKVGD